MEIRASHHTSNNFGAFRKQTSRLNSKPGLPVCVNGAIQYVLLTTLGSIFSDLTVRSTCVCAVLDSKPRKLNV